MMAAHLHAPFSVVEADIEQTSKALASGQITSVELVAAYLNRIAAYDRRGPRLNSTPVLNPDCFAEASRSDAARRQLTAGDNALPPLHGIPFTVKDSYKVAGLTVAAGSPAFSRLVARDDSFAVAALRAQGAVVLGKTNMPPMAVGGCQRGVYGRAESPYNPDYLAAAWHSGSSSGSGVAVAASLCAFGLGEETVSSGRSPASNGGLVAYTPSRGLISIRGNWPLFPLRDTVVPHTRTVTDLLHLLNALVVDDPMPAGDLWKTQPYVQLPPPASVRPRDGFVSLLAAAPGSLRGRRLGIPRMYTGKDTAATEPIRVRPSILKLTDEAVAALTRLGATCIDVDLPVVSAYEKDRPGTQSLVERGMLPDGWNDLEINDLVSAAWEEFLRLNGDPVIPSLAGVTPSVIHADPPDAVDTRRVVSAHDGEDNIRYDYIVDRVRRGVQPRSPLDFSQLSAVCAGLERARKELFEKWMQDEGLDGIVFPANADVAPANADTDERASAIAWQNGVVFSNTNHVLRHLGIPSVSVTMGVMEDTGMPVGLTFAGPAYADTELLKFALEFEAGSGKRVAPPSVPELATAAVPGTQEMHSMPGGKAPQMAIGISGSGRITTTGSARVAVDVCVTVSDLPVCGTEGCGAEALDLSVNVVVDGQHQMVFEKANPSTFESFSVCVEIAAAERRGARLQSSIVTVVSSLSGYGGRMVEGSYAEIPYQYL